MKPKIKYIVLFLVFGSLLIHYVYAYSDSFDIAARDYITITLELSEEDRVSGRITVVGFESIINFTIIDPNESIIRSFQNVGSADFQFMVDEPGDHILMFENYFSDESKQITINYDIQHYIFGYPQEYVLLFIIVGLAIVAVAIFAMLSPKP
jgi:hypothetical protein